MIEMELVFMFILYKKSIHIFIRKNKLAIASKRQHDFIEQNFVELQQQ